MMNKEYKVYHLELTQKCNLNCSYCFYNDNYKKAIKNKFIDFKPFYNFKNKTFWFSGGEPFLHPKIEESIKEIGWQNKINIFTNGTLLGKYTKKIFSKINSLIYTDHFSDCNNKNNKYDFDRIIENLLYLTDETRVFIKKIITKDNYKKVNDFISFYKEKGFKNFSFSIVRLPENSSSFKNISIDKETNYLKEIFKTLKNWEDKINISKLYLKTQEDYLLNNYLDFNSCLALKKQFIHIDCFNKLYLCCEKSVMDTNNLNLQNCNGLFNGGCISLWELYNWE